MLKNYKIQIIFKISQCSEFIAILNVEITKTGYSLYSSKLTKVVA